jgi:hypothetical protein
MVFCPNGAQGDSPGQSEAPPWDPGRNKLNKKPGTVPGVFPTVAWPSEAVRVRDDLIKFIHKRVADPFYAKRGVPGLIKAQTPRPGGLG